jgi:hypothetical protein
MGGGHDWPEPLVLPSLDPKRTNPGSTCTPANNPGVSVHQMSVAGEVRWASGQK